MLSPVASCCVGCSCWWHRNRHSWNTFCAEDMVNESNMREMADALLSNGMAAAGYRTVNVVCNGVSTRTRTRIRTRTGLSQRPASCTSSCRHRAAWYDQNLVCRPSINMPSFLSFACMCVCVWGGITLRKWTGRDRVTRRLTENKELWPNGMASLAKYLHSKGASERRTYRMDYEAISQETLRFVVHRTIHTNFC